LGLGTAILTYGLGHLYQMLIGKRTSCIIALMHKLLLQIFTQSPSGEM